jgi:4-hydroxybenzoate polyprenyltransferase
MVTVPEVLLLVSAVSLAGFAVYFYNDIKDLEDDTKAAILGNKIKGMKPLIQGKISKDLLTKFTVFSAAMSLILASLLNIGVLASLSLYLVLGVLYSTEPFRLKRRFIFKQVIIGSGCVLSILAGALAGGELSSVVIFMILMEIALAFGVNPLMDIPDMQGDKVMGTKTIPVVLGPLMTIRFSIAILIAIAGASIIGYIGLGFSLALPLLMTLIVGTWIYAIMPLMRRYNDIAFTNSVLFKKLVPLYFIIWLVPLTGILF